MLASWDGKSKWRVACAPHWPTPRHAPATWFCLSQVIMIFFNKYLKSFQALMNSDIVSCFSSLCKEGGSNLILKPHLTCPAIPSKRHQLRKQNGLTLFGWTAVGRFTEGKELEWCELKINCGSRQTVIKKWSNSAEARLYQIQSKVFVLASSKRARREFGADTGL